MRARLTIAVTVAIAAGILSGAPVAQGQSEGEKEYALSWNFWLTRRYEHHCANPTGCP